MKNKKDIDEIFQRRLLVWLWWPIGFLIYVGTVMLYESLVGDPPGWLFLVLNIFWPTVYFILSSNAAKFACPKCKQPALSMNVYSSMRKLKCRNCGHPFWVAED